MDVMPVGVTEGMENPAAANIATVGTGYQPDLEAIAALEPDLIFANAQLQAQLLDQLEAIAPTVFVLTLTGGDVPANLRLLGQATWHDTSAEALARMFEQFITLAEKAAAGKEGPSVLIIVGTLDQPNFGKSTTYLGDMVKRLGGTNVADDEPDAGPFPGYAQLSVERVLEVDPDIILTITRGGPAATPIPEAMAADATWSALTAVQNGTVYELDNRLFLEAPGPRFPEALLQLYDLFYGGGM
jgi:iron complex transport system substrate-binding protein